MVIWRVVLLLPVHALKAVFARCTFIHLYDLSIGTLSCRFKRSVVEFLRDPATWKADLTITLLSDKVSLTARSILE